MNEEEIGQFYDDEYLEFICLTKSTREVIDYVNLTNSYIIQQEKQRFLSLIDKLKQDLLADKENPVSGVGALMMLEKML